mgnify:CR=1 FL=1
MEGYCVKCRAKREMVKAKRITTSNGRNAMSGVCKTCGTKMMRFVKKEKIVLLKKVFSIENKKFP